MLRREHPKQVQVRKDIENERFLIRTKAFNPYKELRHGPCIIQKGWLWQAIEALTYVHNKGILHCDLRHQQGILATSRLRRIV